MSKIFSWVSNFNQIWPGIDKKKTKQAKKPKVDKELSWDWQNYYQALW